MNEIIPETTFSIGFIIQKLRISFSSCNLENLEKYESEEICKGLGLFSKIVRIKFYWKNEEIEPKSVVLKIPVLEFPEFVAHLDSAFERELNFYKIFGKYDIKVPKFYYGFPYHRHHNHGIIILEDLSTHGCPLKVMPGLTNDQVEAILEGLAKINVASWKSRDWYSCFKEDDDQPNFLSDIYRYAIKLVELNPEMFESFVKRTKSLFAYETYEKIFYHEDKYGFPPGLVHSDLWAPNILFEKDENGNFTSKLVSIIDWADAHPGNPCEDISRLLAVNTTGEYRRKNTDRLLRFYKEKVDFYNNGKAIFTFEQIQEAYNASLGWTLAFFTFGAPAYYDKPNVVDGTFPGEYKNELLERVRMLYEDVIELYGL